MIVQTKNPTTGFNPTLPPGTVSMPSFYEGTDFTGTTPTGLIRDAGLPINRDKFHVYYDKKWALPPTNQDGLAIKRFVKIRRNVDYRQNATNSVTSGKIWLIVGSIEMNLTFVSSNPVYCFGVHRLWFKDKNAI